MKEEIVSFETAKLAKEKGFDEYTWAYYYKNDKEPKEGVLDDGMIKWNSDSDYNEYTCSAPNQSLLQKWFRENYFIHFHLYVNDNKKWGVDAYLIIKDSDMLLNNPNEFIGFNSYEEALEEGLQFALNRI